MNFQNKIAPQGIRFLLLTPDYKLDEITNNFSEIGEKQQDNPDLLVLLPTRTFFYSDFKQVELFTNPRNMGSYKSNNVLCTHSQSQIIINKTTITLRNSMYRDLPSETKILFAQELENMRRNP